MEIAMLCNPRSGRGRAAVVADRFALALREAGHGVGVVNVGPEMETGGLADVAERAKVIVVVGGDGTVHHAAELAAKMDRPLYHVPTGNENLFAREFGMDGRASTLLAALEGMQEVRADVGRVVSAPGGFVVLMASVGPDASVIHRLAASRSRATGHAAYLGPVFRELVRPRIPRVRVVVDGREVVAGRRGVVIVANCRQYALRINPAKRASMRDGLLDMVFMPCSTRTGSLMWGVRASLGRMGGAVYETGRIVRVDAEEESPVQIDGEAAGVTPIEIALESGVLPVLRP